MSRAGLAARAIRAKEWAQIWRDPSTFGLVVLLPLLLMVLFGSAISLDIKATPLGFVDQDGTQASRAFLRDLQHNPYFRVTEAPSVEALEQALKSGRVRGIVVVPDGYEAAAARLDPDPVQFIADGSQVNTATLLAGHLGNVLQGRAASAARESGAEPFETLTITPRFAFNPEIESRYQLVPGAIGIIMTMIGSLLTALIMAREYERGTMEGLLATPVSVSSLVLNKLLPYYLLGLASTALCVAVAVWLYGLPFRGSVLALFVLSSAFLAAVLGQGLLISAATKNQFVSTQFALLSGFLPSLLLSGFLFEIDAMPAAIRWITYAIPARYLIPPLQSLFLVGDVWPLLVPNVLILLAFGLFFFLRVTRAITRRIA